DADADADAARPYVEVVTGARDLVPEALDRLVTRVAGARRGLIVCGPIDSLDLPAAVARLAAVTGFPILADALSNLRLGPHDRSRVIGRHDAIVRTPSFREGHVPDLVLRFGGTPTSRAVTTWLAENGAQQLVVDDGGWSEPTLESVTLIHAEPAGLAESLAAVLTGRLAGGTATSRADPGWLAAWQGADRAGDNAIREWLAGLAEPFEGRAFADLEGVLPDGAIVVAGNSMPVRDLDAFLGGSAAAIRCLANRGANGIDGVISTALGVAAVNDGPVVLVVGDVSFIHDLNALVAARLHHLPLTVVLVNNDGGGIFSFLPQASAERPEVGLPEHFEELFGTPHGLQLGPVAAALGAEHREVTDDGIGAAVRGSIGRPGVRVLELRTDRARNVELHRECLARVAAALEPLPVRA
ncbi:MAG: 2-succinyl-5-enolpyruvyl-6-hydroxy-3-cyclohexene-1-carboxylic-acid synthase, partial [Chloroflexi bacterium]|nr:2-succinyl-5-enolpyruvyl-6-hydroxy-3-cyclohexene-1-carboxylic-acid synthase [Chloroflexota bacterium]